MMDSVLHNKMIDMYGRGSLNPGTKAAGEAGSQVDGHVEVSISPQKE